MVLLLRDGDYTLGKLKEGRRWPCEWLAAEQASVVARYSVVVEGTEANPSRARLKSKPTWRLDQTPASSVKSWKPHPNRVSKAMLARSGAPLLTLQPLQNGLQCLTAAQGDGCA